MIEAALAGAIAGYAIAIPVGAIAVLIIHVGLTTGFRCGWLAEWCWLPSACAGC